MDSFEKWLLEKKKHDDSKGYVLKDDVTTFLNMKKKFKTFYKKTEKKSTLLQSMYMCSPKFVTIIMNTFLSKGPAVVYTNYVRMEGIEIIKLYLKFFGYVPYEDGMTNRSTYGEFHGGIKDKDARQRTKVAFNAKENKYGSNMKIILFSPAGTEGISLFNVRQMHITEPYWNEVRIKQMIGRAIRQCSHKDLPMQERHVEIFRYKMIFAPDKDIKQTAESSIIKSSITTDQYIEDLARSKDNLLQSFYTTLMEAAVDCELNKAHNMMNREYSCFKFDENTIFDKHIGPAFKDDDYDDDKIDSGSFSTNSITKKIKVIEITGVVTIPGKEEEQKFSEPKKYWFYPTTGVIYDYDLKYPMGRIGFDENKLPLKLNKDTYIIDYVNPIISV
jgi:hypothetical protein